MNLWFEYMAHTTQQHNHMSEVELILLANNERSLMIEANVLLELCSKVFHETTDMVTKTDRLIAITLDRMAAT